MEFEQLAKLYACKENLNKMCVKTKILRAHKDYHYISLSTTRELVDGMQQNAISKLLNKLGNCQSKVFKVTGHERGIQN